MTGPLAPLLLALAPAVAQDLAPGFEAVTLQEPLPLHAEPWPLLVQAWLLPPQDPAWLTSTDPFRSCVLLGSFLPGAQVEFEVIGCPEPMVDAALQASRAWRFAPADPQQVSGSTEFELRYVVRYSEQLATMTTHAALDPGREQAFDGAVGVPGIKLVHPAGVERERSARLPRRARKAALEPQPCSVDLVVDPVGSPAQPVLVECHELLAHKALKLASKWRFTPRVVDGMTEPQELSIQVEFH